MTTNQPLPTLASAANPTPPTDREASRLLRLWVDLTRRAAEAAAHGTGDEDSLRRLQLQVEEQLRDCWPDDDDALDGLVVWEAGLIHVAQTPPETCLICRKARLGLPADLPLPASIGGAR